MRALSAVVVSLLVFAVAPATAGAAKWVGLGDSFAAGPLIPNQSLSPLGCLRSSKNFARLAAASGGHTLTDVSCSGAKTTDMTAPQSTSAGTNPPQLNALTLDTGIVSLQIGGNDIGFTEILQNCVTYNPFGKPCQNRYNPGGNDTISARIRDDRAEGRCGHRRASGCGRPPRGSSSSTTPRSCPTPAPAAGRRSRSPTQTCRTCEPSRRSSTRCSDRAGRGKPASGSSTTTRRASAVTRAGRPARAGSSHWCRAMPPRRSIRMRAAWRASPRWSRRRC